MKPLFSTILCAIISILVTGCAWLNISPTEQNLNRRTVKDIARKRAVSENIDLAGYHIDQTTFVPDRRHWQVIFQENGMLLMAGEEFTVFVNDRNSETKLVRNVGTRNNVRRWELQKEIEKLPVSPPPEWRCSIPKPENKTKNP